jgi:hypothetical protein
MTQTEALRWALEALEGFYEYGYDRLECFEHITAIKEALAQPEQEPVAWEQFYPDIGKPQLEQLPQLSQEVVLQYPKEAVDWQKQQKEYAQQLKVEGPCHVVCQCDKCKAQEQDNAYIYASNLAKTIWQEHYMKESPKFALLDTTEGVLTQIDNMTCGLVREKPAQPEQKYHRGDRLICLETEEYCVIHISGTDRQWVKFPDSHIGVYTNEQVAELFELLPKEPDQEPVGQLLEDAFGRGQVMWFNKPVDGSYVYTTPPQRKPLTRERLVEMADAQCGLERTFEDWVELFARDIEAAHNIKEKNT